MPDVALIRLNNALALFDEFVRNTVLHPDAATLRGLEGRFAERVQIQPSYWSQIKSRSRHIGEKLARQFEARCNKPHGWMDMEHAVHRIEPAEHARAADDDERFVVGLVLTYYRRDPKRAKARLLQLLSEAMDDDSQSNPQDRELLARANAGVVPLKKALVKR